MEQESLLVQLSLLQTGRVYFMFLHWRKAGKLASVKEAKYPVV